LPPLEQAMPGNDEAPDQSARDPGGPDDFEAQEPGEEWAQAEPGRWRTYRNSRFGTVAQIPAFAFEPAIAINGGDGQTFTARDRQSEIAVYGTLLDSQPFGEYRDWYRSELSGISYEAGGRNWFVLSGIAEGRIYYVKVLRSQGCGVDIAHHVVLRYPVASKREFDPLVERLAGSLRGATPQSLCRQ
jgi:hypothetical protein